MAKLIQIFEIVFQFIKNYPRASVVIFMLALIVYKWLKAKVNEDGDVESKTGYIQSQFPPTDLARNFKKHHVEQGKQVDIEVNSKGFEATTTDIFGNEEHFSVKKSRKQI
jgi:hypothetical protein